jgi:hypothetical protein
MWGYFDYDYYSRSEVEETVARYADTFSVCSCLGCGNQRKYYGPPISELRRLPPDPPKNRSRRKKQKDKSRYYGGNWPFQLSWSIYSMRKKAEEKFRFTLVREKKTRLLWYENSVGEQVSPEFSSEHNACRWIYFKATRQIFDTRLDRVISKKGRVWPELQSIF